MFCLVSPESFVPRDHPIRDIKALTNEVLGHLSPLFSDMYSDRGRPSIPPETLLKSSLLMALYTIRSERQFCEQLKYNLLFRWFLDMDMTDEPFNASTFSKNRERMLDHDVAEEFFLLVVEAARSAQLLSRDHFTVDGTLIEAWASLKSFRPRTESKDDKEPPEDRGNPDVNFKGEKRKNDTHASTTDPEAKLHRKGLGKEAKLCFAAHALMENRNGLLLDLKVTTAGTAAEWDAGAELIRGLPKGATIGGDKGYDVKNFVDPCRELGITPHVAQRSRGSRLDRRTTRHPGYVLSQRIRKKVEEIFGWAKTVGGFRKTRYRGIRRTQLAAHMVGAAYNLLRITKLMAASA